MKELKNLTIKEYYEYEEMLKADTPDVFGIFELFGEDATKMPFDEFEKKMREIQNMHIPSDEGVHKYYKLNGKRYKASLNHLKLSAGQFIDFQSYMKDFKMEEVLSVFLIPQTKSWRGWSTPKYNDGYDVLKVQEDILNHMTIGQANNLRAFFLKLSTLSLKTMKAFSEKKEFKMRKKKLKMQKQGLLE